MINYILAELVTHKDPSLKDKIIKLFKYFCHYYQFIPNNCHCTNKWTLRMLKDKLLWVLKYKIHQALIEILDSNYAEPDNTLTDSQYKVNIVSMHSIE